VRVVYIQLSSVAGSQRQRNLLIPAMRDRISFNFSVVMGAKVREVYRLSFVVGKWVVSQVELFYATDTRSKIIIPFNFPCIRGLYSETRISNFQNETLPESE
jgi:hypothetical protein